MMSFHFRPNCDLSMVDSICIGSGRFLRSVLVPALNDAHFKPAIFQTRGKSFVEYCAANNNNDADNFDNASNSNDNLLRYEVDTVDYDGTLITNRVSCHAAGTLGTPEGKAAIMILLEKMKEIRVIGVGVTEAGLASPKSQALIDLTDILRKCHCLLLSSHQAILCPNPNGRICVVNTDNVPNNGDLIRKYVLDIARAQNKEKQYAAGDSFVTFLERGGGVTFHNSMVDRITSQRPRSDGMVPRCEPVPAKAIVIEDIGKDLPPSLYEQSIKHNFGVVVRANPGELNADITLKLRVANGTHTAIAHTMALSSLLQTDVLSITADASVGPVLLNYIDSLFEEQILAGARIPYGVDETRAVYDDWRKRLCHAHFGLSTFFITQNGAAKGGIRIAPTVRSLCKRQHDVSSCTIFCLAVILRFLTPSQHHCRSSSPTLTPKGVYTGWLDSFQEQRLSSYTIRKETPAHTVTYADGLRHNIVEGWYEFKCTCQVLLPSSSGSTTNVPLSDVLMDVSSVGSTAAASVQPCVVEDAVIAYLSSGEGGDMADLQKDPSTNAQFTQIARAVATLYARMVSGDHVISLLKEINVKNGV